MRKFVVIIALAVTAALAVTTQTPAQAQARFVSIQAPTVTQAGKVVVVSGHAPSWASVVRIERRSGSRWTLVRRAAVRAGRYSVRIRPTGGISTLRARVSNRSSSTTTLRFRPPSTTPTTPPAPTPTTPAGAGTDACGTQPVKADGSFWNCTFDDEFSGTTLDRSKWMPQTNFASGVQAAHACYRDDPSVVNQADGYLNLSVLKVATPVSCSFGALTGPTNYLAGSVMSYHLFAQQYGRFEAKIRTTATTFPGLQETFWLWPDDRVASGTVWPTAGEIDVSEAYSLYPGLSIPFLHYSADVYGAVPGTNTAWNCTAYRGTWNTYTLEWTATQLVLKINGNTCLVNNSADPAFKKPYILALTQLMGGAGNAYDGRAPVPATMNVDYVKVWK